MLLNIQVLLCKQALDVLYEIHLDSKNGRIEEPEKKGPKKNGRIEEPCSLA